MSLKSKAQTIRKELGYWTHRPRRVLFDHLPKCGGSTINRYLSRHYPRRFRFKTHGERAGESVKEFLALPQSSRYNYRLIFGHRTNQLLDYVHPDTITLTIFRDPIDRVVSNYFFAKQNVRHRLHDYVMKSNVQLEDFVLSGLSPTLRNYYATHFTGRTIEEVERDPEESVRLALEMILKQFDIVGFQEDLPAVVQKLRKSAHLSIPFDNPTRNKTIERLPLQEVPEKTKKTIADVNFLDVELYALLRTRLTN